MRRNRLLVVLVLMSLFVVSTQAFSVTSDPVVVDWQYDPWGDSGLVIVTSSEVYTQVTTNQVTFSFQLRNDGSNTETATLRVELVDTNGDRVAITGQSNTDPDDDTQWLVATEQTTSAMAPANTWTSADFAFNDANVDSTISGGGYFVIYASTGTDMNSYDIAPIDRTPTFPTPFKVILRPTAFTDTNTQWNLETQAYDVNNATSSDESQSRIINDIYFTTWEDNADVGTISQVDVIIYMDLVGLSNDVVDINVFNSNGQTTSTYQITSANEGTGLLIRLSDIAEPGDGTWTWAEVGSLDVRLDGTKTAGHDNVADYEVFEIWARVTGT